MIDGGGGGWKEGKYHITGKVQHCHPGRLNKFDIMFFFSFFVFRFFENLPYSSILNGLGSMC